MREADLSRKGWAHARQARRENSGLQWVFDASTVQWDRFSDVEACAQRIVELAREHGDEFLHVCGRRRYLGCGGGARGLESGEGGEGEDVGGDLCKCARVTISLPKPLGVTKKFGNARPPPRMCARPRQKLDALSPLRRALPFGYQNRSALPRNLVTRSLLFGCAHGRDKS